MKINEVVKCIVKARQIKLSGVANSIGIQRQTVNYRLNHTDNMTVNSAVQLLEGCGYRLVAIPKENPMPRDAYEVTE